MILIALLAIVGGYLLLVPGSQKSKSIAVERSKVATPEKKGGEPPAPKSVADTIAKREPVGMVTQFKGLAVANFENVKRTLAEGAPVYQGDQIITGKDARLIMKMRDDAVIALGPDSEFLIQDYRFEPENEQGNGVVDMTRGLVRFNSGKLAQMKNQPFKVVTPVATMGVRGTEGFVRLGDGKGKDREIEVISLQKMVLVWMEEVGPPGPTSSSGELFFSKSWSLIAEAWAAADTSKQPLSVKKGERLNGSVNKAPEIRKASREELKGAYGGTTVRKLSGAALKKLNDQVAKSLVDKGLAPDRAAAEALLKKTPQAVDELVKKAEEKLEKELDKALDKKIDQDEKLAKLDDKLKEALGEEGFAKVQEVEREQAAQIEKVRQERSERIAELVTDTEKQQTANEIIAAQEERKAELRAELAQQITKAEAEKDTKKLNALQTELNTKLNALEKETHASLVSLLGGESAAKINEVVKEVTAKEAELAKEGTSRIEAVIPKEKLEAVRGIEQERERVQATPTVNLNDVGQSSQSLLQVERAIQAIANDTATFVNGIADAVKAGVPLEQVLQGLQDSALERQKNEANRLGVDLNAASKNADELMKQLENTPYLPKKTTDGEKPKTDAKTKTEEPGKPTEEPPTETRKAEGDTKPKGTLPPVAETPSATTTVPASTPTPPDAAGSLASSGAGTTTTTTTSITINNAPTMAMQTFTIKENAEPNSVVGVLIAMDPDVADQSKLRFNLTDEFNGTFAVDGATGKITVLNAAKLDFETNPSIRLTATVSDQRSGSASATVWVVLTDVNEAPTVTAEASQSFEENATGVVYEATAIDQDVDDSFTWSIVGTDAGYFTIDAKSGVVKFRSPPDFENPNHAPAYVFDVVATDKKGLYGSKTVTINVTDVNETPVITSESGVSFVENGTGVAYQATATDPDAADKNKLTWSLGGEDKALFEINGQTGDVRFLAKPDFESPKDVGGDNLYSLTVTVTDVAGLSASKAITITVLDQSTVSITSAETVTFDENATGVAYQPKASDPDPGDEPRIWSMVGADAAQFNINAATGAVTFNLLPDYENPKDLGKQNSYHITVQVSDKNKYFASKAVTIQVLDLNEAPKIIATAPSVVNFAENGTGVAYQTTATDLDKNDTLSWSLAGEDAALFTIDGATGAVKFAVPPDFESPQDKTKQNSYHLTVKVQDKGGLTDSKDLTITVTDVNEAPSITSGATGSFVENGTGVVYQATAIDADAGDLFAWSVGGKDQSYFTIDPTSGELRFKSPPDYESTSHAPVHVVDVIATDRAGLSGSKSVTITVTDQLPVITSGASATFPENGTGIAYQATATVLDVGDGTRVWSLKGLDAPQFTIDANGAVQFVNPPDFESPHDVGLDNSHEIIVVVTDKGNLSDSKAVTITVTNVNEAPKINPAAPTAVNFAENGTGIAYQTTASDLDAGDVFTWSLTGSDAALFTMDPTSGAVRFVTPPDFESTTHAPAYALNVVVTDKLGLFDTKAVTVTVTDVNEAPIITSAASGTFAENGTGIAYQATASDPDAGDLFTWSLAGVDAALFTLDAASGAVSFKTPPDYESATHTPSYAITVTVTDKGGLPASLPVTIAVTPVNEAPQINPAAPAAANFVENGSGIAYQTTATDPDAGDLLTFTWSLAGADANAFTIDPTSGAVRFVTPPDFESKSHTPTYVITVIVTDVGGLSDSKAVTITVTDVNEAPVITSAASVSFAENGTGVAYLATAVDPDAGDAVTWSLSGVDAELFTIDPVTGDVRFKASPDFENPQDAGKNNGYDIVVAATDKKGLATSLAVAITVTDVIENPSITSGSTATFPENGTGIAYQATALPPGVGDVFTWTITGVDAGRFSINPTTGALSFLVPPDFEAPTDNGVNNVYDILVTVTNTKNLSDSKAVAITVTDVNEKPTITSAATASFVENAIGTAYQATAIDPDTVHGDVFTWSLLPGADAGWFNIDLATGAVTFKTPPDFEDGHGPTYTITVVVTDALGLTDSKDVKRYQRETDDHVWCDREYR
ncbi:MAG: cadherin domain-containing protein [Magnetococcus sp. YQC-9]